ncbi:MAG: nuclear transport factor 2 family protein [Chloroflexota bacterium]
MVRGRDALKAHFGPYLERLPGLQLVSTDKFRETEDTIFFEATVNIDPGTVRVCDAFVLRDGKATHHFTGVPSFTPKA